MLAKLALEKRTDEHTIGDQSKEVYVWESSLHNA